MPKLGALTKISKQAVERAENFTSGRNRLRGGPPLTRSALLPVALQSLIEMALNTNLAVRHTLRSSLEDEKEEAIEYVPPLAVSQNTSTMTRLVELRDTMIWILNTESKPVLPARVVVCSKSFLKHSMSSSRLCHDKMRDAVTIKLELDKNVVQTSCLRLDPRCELSNEYIVIIRDAKEKVLLRLDASSTSRGRNDILRPIVVNGSSVSIEVQKLQQKQQQTESSCWGFACSLWAASTKGKIKTRQNQDMEFKSYDTDDESSCRRLDSCLVNLVNNLVDRMRSRGRASSYDDEDEESSTNSEMCVKQTLRLLRAPVGANTITSQEFERCVMSSSERDSTFRDVSLEDLKTRFALLRHFNMELASLIHMMDLSNVSNVFTMASLLRKMGHCVFSDVKMRLLNNVLSATRVSARYSLRLDLDRGIAFQTKENRVVECLDRNHHTIFAQSFEQLHKQPADAFKRADRAFTVRFRGERGVDVGGPYVIVFELTFLLFTYLIPHISHHS